MIGYGNGCRRTCDCHAVTLTAGDESNVNQNLKDCRCMTFDTRPDAQLSVIVVPKTQATYVWVRDYE